MIKNLFLFFAVLGMFAALSRAQVSSVTGQYLQDNNLLINPGFESGIGKWTNSAGTFTADYSVFVQGKASGKVVLSSQALNFFQDSTLFSSQLADGMQAILTVKIKSSVAGVRVCPRQAGIVITSLCVSVQGNNKWGLYQIPFVTGATSQGISIYSNSTSITGTVYVDESYVGVSNILNSSSEAKLAGEAYFAGTAGCTWSRTSTTIGAFGSVAACPGPTIVSQNLGSWQTTDSDLPRVTVNNLPAGTYKATFSVNTAQTTASANNITITDGTTSCIPAIANPQSSSTASHIVYCVFNYSSAGNKSFELNASSAANTIQIDNTTATGAVRNTKFILEYYGSNSTYTTLNANTDWASCGHTTSDFTGFGTVSSIETRCKREGGDLLIRGNFTSGATTPTEARLNLKLNGQTLTSRGTATIPSLQRAGGFATQTSGATYFGNGNILIEPSVAYNTFGIQQSALASANKANGDNITTLNQRVTIEARIPIEGWQNSNIIIGEFKEVVKVLGLDKQVICSADILNNGTASFSSQKGNCFSSVARSTVGRVAITIDSSKLSSAPICTLSVASGAGVNFCKLQGFPTSSTIDTTCYTTSANSDQPFSISCLGTTP